MNELPALRSQALARGEKVGIAVLAATIGAWLLMPKIAQDPRYHAFADQRSWLGIAHAADVLSNLAFLLVGASATAALASRRRPRYSTATETGLWCIAIGFIATAAGSAWYHLDPNDATLVWDRLPMTLVFTGVLGTAVAQRIGDNAARVGLVVLFGLGVASIVYWRTTGDLSLYVALQFGGIAALLLLSLVTRRGDDPFRWGWLIAWYAVAKIFEAADRAVWDASAGLIAGHTLKHLFAAAGGYVLLRPLTKWRRVGAHRAPSAPPVPL